MVLCLVCVYLINFENMTIQVLLFGITSDLLKTTQLEIDVVVNCVILDFKILMKDRYPQLVQLPSYAIAVNERYATDDVILKENDVVAIIPPVSGG